MKSAKPRAAAPTIDAAPPPVTGSSARAVAAALEEDIVFGRLHPRQRLVEQDLVERFGSNRAAVRLALFELEKDGMIERIPNRGAMVRDLTPEEVIQIYAVREELEVMAACSIPLPVSREDLRHLKQLQDRHSRAIARGDLREVFYANLDFHRSFFGLCGNPYLIEAIETFAQKVYPIRSHPSIHPSYQGQLRQDHLDLIEALREGDRPRLAKLCRQHLRPSRESYVAAYQQRFKGVQNIR